jgi:hypothetical protein
MPGGEMVRGAIHNLHVPLPEEVYGDLRAESERAAQPATVLVRQAIIAWLEERRRERTAKEIGAYARSVAGTADDLDVELERAGVENLVRPRGRRRKR